MFPSNGDIVLIKEAFALDSPRREENILNISVATAQRPLQVVCKEIKDAAAARCAGLTTKKLVFFQRESYPDRCFAGRRRDVLKKMSEIDVTELRSSQLKGANAVVGRDRQAEMLIPIRGDSVKHISSNGRCRLGGQLCAETQARRRLGLANLRFWQAQRRGQSRKPVKYLAEWPYFGSSIHRVVLIVTVKRF